MDVVQDVIDSFWEEPYAFAFVTHSRHPEDCIDMFAGRVYTEQPSPGLLALRRILATSRKGKGE